MGNFLASVGEVRRGLPQGGVLSPLAAHAFVGRDLRAVLGDVEVARYSFVDDLISGARSQPELEEAVDALRSRLLQHPAGPISLHVHPPTSTKYGRVLVFKEAVLHERGDLDSDLLEAETVRCARELHERYPDMGAILLECAMLPPYAKAVQDETGLPVFDFLTMIDYFYAGTHRKA